MFDLKNQWNYFWNAKKTCVHLNQWTFETVGLQIIDRKDNKISRETESVENEAFIV